MTDRDLIQPGYVFIEIIQIFQTQVMACIQSQSQAAVLAASTKGATAASGFLGNAVA